MTPPTPTSRLRYPVPVLLYHRVVEKGGSARAVGIDRFRAHLNALQRGGWRSLRLAEFESLLRGEHESTPRRFLLTVDDGHDDLPLIAEELEAFGFTGVAFLVTDWLKSEAGHISLEQAKALAAQGIIECASHTHHHRRYYAGEGTLAEVRTDLHSSMETLRHLGGDNKEIALRHLAWPWGRFTEGMPSLAIELGFTHLYSVANVPVLSRDQIHNIPRLCVERMSPQRFSLLMKIVSTTMGGHLMCACRRLKRRILNRTLPGSSRPPSSR